MTSSWWCHLGKLPMQIHSIYNNHCWYIFKRPHPHLVNQEIKIAVLPLLPLRKFTFFPKPKIAFRCITIHSWLHISEGFVSRQDFSAWLCRWMLLCPPTYFVKWTITFWLSSLIPQDHDPIVYFIPLLWVLCISEIAKIVDPLLWNSTSFIWAVAWITSSSSAENMHHAPAG